MANGFGSFYVGNSGLQSSQNALNVTANNLANVDTTGYVREQVRFADKTYITRVAATTSTNGQQNGLGVSIGDVAHAREIFLDKTYRQENGRKSFYETSYESTSYVEDILQELDGQEFKTSVEDFWQSFQELAKDPTNSTNQNLILQKAELLVSRSTSVYSDLQKYQSNINDQIQSEVSRINEIGARIYEINLEVQKVESTGIETAMTLRDERDALIDELSSYVKIDVKEDSTGFDYISVEGVPLIDDYRSNTIELQRDPKTGFYFPYWSQLSDSDTNKYQYVFNVGADITTDSTGKMTYDQAEVPITISTEGNTDIGSLYALMLARGYNYGEAEDMLPENYSSIEDNVVMETEAEIAYLFKSIITSVNDTLCPNTTYTASDGTEYTVLDTDNCGVGSDGNLPPQELFVRQGYDRYTEMQIDGQTFYVYNEEDPDNKNTWYELSNIAVNSVISKEVTKLPTYTQNGADNYAVAQALVDIWSNENLTIDPNDTSPCNFENYYNKIVDKLGNSGTVYNTAVTTLDSTITSIESQRQQIIGVSSDEELTNMVKFQSAYNAASRYITVIAEMTDVIVGLI